jgi:hypothetical protein
MLGFASFRIRLFVMRPIMRVAGSKGGERVGRVLCAACRNPRVCVRSRASGSCRPRQVVSNNVTGGTPAWTMLVADDPALRTTFLKHLRGSVVGLVASLASFTSP